MHISGPSCRGLSAALGRAGCRRHARRASSRRPMSSWPRPSSPTDKRYDEAWAICARPSSRSRRTSRPGTTWASSTSPSSMAQAAEALERARALAPTTSPCASSWASCISPRALRAGRALSSNASASGRSRGSRLLRGLCDTERTIRGALEACAPRPRTTRPSSSSPASIRASPSPHGTSGARAVELDAATRVSRLRLTGPRASPRQLRAGVPGQPLHAELRLGFSTTRTSRSTARTRPDAESLRYRATESLGELAP